MPSFAITNSAGKFTNISASDANISNANVSNITNLSSLLAVHVDNAAAITAKVPIGTFYRTASGAVMVRY